MIATASNPAVSESSLSLRREYPLYKANPVYRRRKRDNKRGDAPTSRVLSAGEPPAPNLH